MLEKKAPTWKIIQFHLYLKLTTVKYFSKTHVTGALQPGSFTVDAKSKVKIGILQSKAQEVAMLRFIFKDSKSGFLIYICLA